MNILKESKSSEFVVSLDLFEGPLDLLLFLVRREEVPIEDISIAKITDQYLNVLRSARDIDVDDAGDFLVMAATLVEIKAKVIAPLASDNSPTLADVTVQEEDPKSHLIKQLLMFQSARTGASILKDLSLEASNRFPVKIFGRGISEPKWTPIDPEDFHPIDLSEHYEKIASSIDFSRLGDHKIEFDETPLELHQTDLLDQLNRRLGEPLALLDTFYGKKPSDRIGLFLATLELVRQRRLWVRQDEIFKDIFIGLKNDSNIPDEASTLLQEKDLSIDQPEDL